MKYYSLAKNDDTAEMMIYGDITSFKTEENEVSGYSFVEELAALGDVAQINVHINSYGGECSEALAIVNALERHPAKVVTFNDGFACSAAATVFMAGDERIASKYCSFLFHNAWTIATGNADELRSEAANLDVITKQSKELYLAKSNLTEAELDALMAEERFITPEEALKYGFATKIEDTDAGDEPKQNARMLIMNALEKPMTPKTANQRLLDFLKKGEKKW